MTMERAARLAFGSEARELNARALEPSGSNWRFALGSAAGEARFLERLEARVVESSQTPRRVLEVSGESLRQLANEDESAACLVAAHENAQRPLPTPQVMGILNLTPDSFSDGGELARPEDALARAREMVALGASRLDLGGESTRPGAEEVPVDVELERVLPVIELLKRELDVPLSIDTRKAAVAEAALEAGCVLVNDVSGGRFDPTILRVVAERDASYVCMHSRGLPATMQNEVEFVDPTAEIALELRQGAQACLNAGIALHKIVLDPGIGFGKRLVDNLDVLRRLSELRSLGLPLLVGASRKSFIGHLEARDGLAESAASQRIGGTAAAVAASVAHGAEILRVHDVSVMAQAVRVALALRTPRD